MIKMNLYHIIVFVRGDLLWSHKARNVPASHYQWPWGTHPACLCCLVPHICTSKNKGQDRYTCWGFGCGVSSSSISRHSIHNAWRFTDRCSRVYSCRHNYSHVCFTFCGYKRVVMTKSVEYMPFLLSFSLSSSVLIWTCYAILELKVIQLFLNNLAARFSIKDPGDLSCPNSS
ncbi:unnamed protein product, partial [Vitis vinifera]|uniref:Uncharacterized protein n=1 Tax=Vitis vinifera TaxID=29760 RepID=D7U9X8_VITVI